MLRRPALLALLALSLPAAARADLIAVGAEVYGGFTKNDVLKNGPGTLSDKALLKSGNTHFGLLGTLKLTSWEFGALAELGQNKGSTATTAVGALVGPAIDIGDLRLEVLGEVGGRRYGNFLDDPQVVTKGSSQAWLAYVGARPGLSYRFGTVLKMMVGVWAFGRWDVTTKEVPVTVTPSAGGPSVSGNYKLGGSTFGGSLRFGIYL
jgi:hypothetical protein